MTYLFVLVAIVTANFKRIIIYMSIIFVHELGHLIAAKYYKWNTDKIYIYPLGGITKFNDSINRALKEELIIILMGPIFQIVYYYFLILLGVDDIYLFNFFLLGFNLLPIYPLDGGKILNVVLSFIFSYRFSYKITFFVSFIFYFLLVFFVLILSSSVFFIIVTFFLVFKIVEEFSKRKYYFNKFLLERYLGNYRFKKMKCVDSVDRMRRDRTHLFYDKGSVITEREMLKKYFN